MKFIKLKYLSFILAFIFFSSAPVSVLALDNDALYGLKDVRDISGYAEADEFTMSKLIGTVISSFLSLLGIVFVVLMLYGGFKWMKATGREDEVGKAQDIIRNAIIGLILTASSYAIYSFVMSGL